jgi:hypothetical protein
MAYSSAQHATFAERVKNFCREAYHLGMVEGVALDLIYLNEAESGNNANFADTAENTEAELIDGIIFIRRLKQLCDGSGSFTHENNLPRLTPFLQ